MLKLWENPILSRRDRLDAAGGEIERLRGLLNVAGDKVIELSGLLTRATRQLDLWQEKYGEWLPEWLPTSGDVRLAEDASEALRKATEIIKTCMNCGTSGCDHKDARRCSNGHSLWTPNVK
jgi:hypothetical protein